MMAFPIRRDVRRCLAFVLVSAFLATGCVGGTDPGPTAEPGEPATLSPIPRVQESQEFSGRLPVTFRGLNATDGTSNFTADFGRVSNWTTIEITISVERVKAPGYTLTVLAEGRESSSGFDGIEPYVFHTDLDGPYEVAIKANGPDLEGTAWKANVTQYSRGP